MTEQPDIKMTEILWECARCKRHVTFDKIEFRLKCVDCRREERHAPYKHMSPEARRKSNARAYANTYQKRGLVEKKHCEQCGAEKAEKHHDDYSKPLEVRWLCRVCHNAHHVAERKAARTLSTG